MQVCLSKCFNLKRPFTVTWNYVWCEMLSKGETLVFLKTIMNEMKFLLGSDNCSMDLISIIL